MLTTIFIWTLIGITIIQLVYWFIFSHFAFWKRSSLPSFLEPVSIVIVARNEAENLRKNLPIILGQDYPQFEVVVVNDRSWDDTRFVIEEMMDSYPDLRLTHVNETEEFWLGKKYGLTIGIKAARHPYLLLTDADCTPSSDKWLRYMASGFNEGSLILGYGAYRKYPGWLNLIIRYETLITGLQYLSFALFGSPYMGVGRNMAYTKDLFFSNRGFVKHMHLASGDDDLFVNEVGNAQNTTIVAEPLAHTISEPKRTWKEWWHQKRRHQTTGLFYNRASKRILGLYGASQILYYPILLISLFLPGQWMLALSFYGAKIVIQYILLLLAGRNLKQWDAIASHVVLDILLPWFTLLWHIQNRLYGKPKKW
ncbi:MAG: glycosyltransferase [Bacteroidota bacterium]|nr:glycosyltransferase [Bacteroidota bacterium]MDX5506692.1 glycosyltransferase [Bacteroidota bacterium]